LIMKEKSRESALSFRFADAVSISREERNNVFSVGIPSAILTGLFDVANIFLNSLMASHGDLDLAAIGIVMKAERLPNAINIGLCQGMLPLIAYNYSSGNWKRMNRIIHTVRIYGVIIAGISVILFELFASGIVHLFLSTSVGDIAQSVTTIGLAAVFLRFRCLASVSQFLNYSTSFCMQAVGDGRDTLIHAVVRQAVFYIPLMYLFNALLGVNGLAAALVVGETCSAVFAYILLERWKKKNLQGSY
jgi:multidrug efflux pump